jgi:hypothetical protein
MLEQDRWHRVVTENFGRLRLVADTCRLMGVGQWRRGIRVPGRRLGDEG